MKKTIKSLTNASRGVGIILKEGRNIKIYLFIIALCVLLGFSMSISTGEWLVLLVFFGLVLSAEAFNTGLEHTLDCVSLDHREDIRDAKDVAAGAVLLAGIVNLIAVLVIFLPKVL